MDKLVSIIVPVYKVEPYLPACVDSILSQTHQHIEVILVDDGSPDGCGRLCDGYAEMDARVTVIHKTNGGLSDARNAGMAIAKGEFLMFVDSDDLLTPDAVRTLLELALKEDAELVIGGHDRFEDLPPVADQDAAQYQVFSAKDAMADMFRNGCAAWARIYRREIHQDIPYPVGRINEDEAIVLQLLDRCDRIVKSPKVIYHYRCRPESITTATFSEKKVDWYRHCMANLSWVQEKEPDLVPLALDRLGSCIVFLLHQMAVFDYRDDALAGMLLQKLKADHALFQKHYLSGKKEKLRMWFLAHFPYGIYRWMIGCQRRAARHGKM